MQMYFQKGFLDVKVWVREDTHLRVFALYHHSTMHLKTTDVDTS